MILLSFPISCAICLLSMTRLRKNLGPYCDRPCRQVSVGSEWDDPYTFFGECTGDLGTKRS